MPDYRNSKDLQNDKDFSFGATMDKASELAKMLQQNRQFQQQLQQPIELQNQKELAKQAEEQRNIDRINEFMKGAKPGEVRQAKFGDIEQKIGEDNPQKYVQHQTQMTNAASGKAYKGFADSLTKLRSSVDSAGEGLQAINDPKQGGSLGIARSNMLRTMGMNRYNENEAKATLPPNLLQQAQQIFAGATNGWDGKEVRDVSDSNPMTPEQKAATENFFKSHIAHALKTHDQLKNQAQGSLQASGVADPVIQANLNDAMDKAGFKDYATSLLTPKPGSIPSNYNSPPAGSGTQSAPQQQGMIDKLKSMFGVKPQPQSPQSPMTFEEFKAKRASGEIK